MMTTRTVVVCAVCGKPRSVKPSQLLVPRTHPWTCGIRHRDVLKFLVAFRTDAAAPVLRDALIDVGSPNKAATALGISMSTFRNICHKNSHASMGTHDRENGDGFYQRLAALTHRTVARLRPYFPLTGQERIHATGMANGAAIAIKYPPGSPKPCENRAENQHGAAYHAAYPASQRPSSFRSPAPPNMDRPSPAG